MTNVLQMKKPITNAEITDYQEITSCLAQFRAQGITLDGDRAKLSRLIMCRFRTANAMKQNQTSR